MSEDWTSPESQDQQGYERMESKLQRALDQIAEEAEARGEELPIVMTLAKIRFDPGTAPQGSRPIVLAINTLMERAEKAMKQNEIGEVATLYGRCLGMVEALGFAHRAWIDNESTQAHAGGVVTNMLQAASLCDALGKTFLSQGESREVTPDWMDKMGLDMDKMGLEGDV